MNLPKVSNRIAVVSQAKVDFTKQTIKKFEELAPVDFGYDRMITIYSRLMLNLLGKGEEYGGHICFRHPLEESYSKVLEQVSFEHGLTLGEQMYLLSDATNWCIKDVLSHEREESIGIEG